MPTIIGLSIKRKIAVTVELFRLKIAGTDRLKVNGTDFLRIK